MWMGSYSEYTGAHCYRWEPPRGGVTERDLVKEFTLIVEPITVPHNVPQNRTFTKNVPQNVVLNIRITRSLALFLLS